MVCFYDKWMETVAAMSEIQITESRDKPIAYSVEGDNCWGNSICFDHDEFKELVVDRVYRFHGWKRDRPIIDDYYEVKMKSGNTLVFQVVEMTYHTDPHDLFFSKAKLIGYSKDIEDYNPNRESSKKVDYFE